MDHQGREIHGILDVVGEQGLQHPALAAAPVLLPQEHRGVAVEAGQFRQDLLFRLAVVTLTLPPLRRRRGDIPLLATHFLKRAAQRMGKNVSEIAPEAFDRLLAYAFPGNVHELESIIEGAVAQATGSTLTAELLPDTVTNPATAGAATGEIKTLDEIEREHILKALEHTGGNRALAAQLLGIDRVSLWRKLRRYNEES